MLPTSPVRRTQTQLLRPASRRRQRGRSASTVLVAVVLSLIVAITAGSAIRMDVMAAAAANQRTVSAGLAKVTRVSAVAVGSASAADSVAALITESTGQVLDQKSIDVPAEHVRTARSAQSALASAVTSARTQLNDNRVHGSASAADYEAATARAQSVDVDRQGTAVTQATTVLGRDAVRIRHAVRGWKAEQARLAAVKAEAERVARAAALAEAERVAQAAANAAPHASHVAPTANGTPTSGGKLAIAQAVFARFGFGNAVFDTGQSGGHYAGTKMDSGVIYIQLSAIPANRVASVCIHEYMHILQARMYGGYSGTVAHFGSVLGMEKDADRMARANGATWTNY
jgi:hypothetical protein